MRIQTVLFTEQIGTNSSDVLERFINMWRLRVEAEKMNHEVHVINPEDTLKSFVNTYYPIREDSSYDTAEIMHQLRLNLLNHPSVFGDYIKMKRREIMEKYVNVSPHAHLSVLIVIHNVYDTVTFDMTRKDSEDQVGKVDFMFHLQQSEEERLAWYKDQIEPNLAFTNEYSIEQITTFVNACEVDGDSVFTPIVAEESVTEHKVQINKENTGEIVLKLNMIVPAY